MYKNEVESAKMTGLRLRLLIREANKKSISIQEHIKRLTNN